MNAELIPVWVCVDCYFAHHYGKHEYEGRWFSGESDEPSHCEPLSRLGDDDVSDWTCSDHYYGQDPERSEDDWNEYAEPCDHCGGSSDENGMQEFSWRSCDGCMSHLGGSRYRLAIHVKEDA